MNAEHTEESGASQSSGPAANQPPAVHLDASGKAAPPRANGELVFASPWESRVFGLTMALCEREVFSWQEFRELLIDEIGAWDLSHPSGQAAAESSADTIEYSYYDHWLAALEGCLVAKGICESGAIAALAGTLAQRPAGHDHVHPHSHPHPDSEA